MNQRPLPHPAVRTLALVRVTILTGALLIGGIIWFLQRDPSWIPTGPRFPVQPIAVGLWAAAIVSVLGLRLAWGRTKDVKRRVHFSIMALAVAEAPALYGAVVYFLSGDPRLYLTGVFLMLTTLIVFPITGHR